MSLSGVKKRDKNLNRFFQYNFSMKNRKGQLTIFIIIAIVIVALAVFAYMFFPQIKSTIGIEQQSPQSFIQTCLEQDIKDTVEKVSLQGGSINPELYTLYQDNKVEYLCYTNQYLLPCIMQQPLLKQHIESEIKSNIGSYVEACFSSLQKNFERRGYTVNIRNGPTRVELLPKRIVTTMNYSVTLTRTGTENYNSFDVILNNNLYELTSIATSILDWESKYGDANFRAYMTYYRDLKVEQKGKSDGSKIYVLTDLNTDNKFEFAVRSVVYPSGFG